MPRRGNVPKREILPDPIYGSVLVTKLVNSIMLDGKKGVAQKVVYGAFQIVEEKTGKSGLEAFQTAMENIMPAVESRLVVSAVRTIRFRSRFARKDARPLDCAG